MWMALFDCPLHSTPQLYTAPVPLCSPSAPPDPHFNRPSVQQPPSPHG